MAAFLSDSSGRRPIESLKAELVRNRQEMNLKMYETEDEAVREPY